MERCRRRDRGTVDWCFAKGSVGAQKGEPERTKIGANMLLFMNLTFSARVRPSASGFVPKIDIGLVWGPDTRFLDSQL